MAVVMKHNHVLLCYLSGLVECFVWGIDLACLSLSGLVLTTYARKREMGLYTFCSNDSLDYRAVVLFFAASMMARLHRRFNETFVRELTPTDHL